LSLTDLLLSEPAPAERYTLSLDDALPICGLGGHLELKSRRKLRRTQYAERILRKRFVGNMTQHLGIDIVAAVERINDLVSQRILDRKSTRLNSSHVKSSYAVFCLKKKNK